MRKMGLETFLPDRLQAQIIVTFRTPKDPAFYFQKFYDSLRDKGYVIYPGKLTSDDTFRIGCIGNLFADDMKGALAAIRKTFSEMGVRAGTPTAV
jgi:2-aminoethylphosphonate-pyruvate transaminase